jgi:hypothetical protein
MKPPSLSKIGVKAVPGALWMEVLDDTGEGNYMLLRYCLLDKKVVLVTAAHVTGEWVVEILIPLGEKRIPE